MGNLFFIILGGLLTRADGWGPENPRFKKFASFFNTWTCGGIFAMMMLAYTQNLLASFVAGMAFVAWRAPGFDGWENWLNMFLRGAWTSLVGFTLLSVAAHQHVYYGWLAIPMGIAEMVAYSGSYKWLPGRIPNWLIHPIAEISSGVAFTAFIMLILAGL